MAVSPADKISFRCPGLTRHGFLFCFVLAVGALAPTLAQSEGLPPGKETAASGSGNAAGHPLIDFRPFVYGEQNYSVNLLPSTTENLASPSSDAVRIYRFAAVSLPQNGRTLTAFLASSPSASRYAVRLRYKLEGYDPDWRDLGNASMHFVLKFFDSNRIPVSRVEFRNSGDSVGWTGNIAGSRMTRRSEAFTVPARAVWMDVWIDSGGHDETTGVWLVDDLRICEADMPGGNPGSANNLLSEDFEQGKDLDQPQGDLDNWVRDGGALDGAMVWKGPPARGGHGLLIVDSNPADYAAWRRKDHTQLKVTSGQQLRLEYAEVFSIGRGRGGEISYPNLPSGHYQLRVQEVSASGVPTGEEAIVPLIIAPPFYENAWFQAAMAAGILSIALGIERLNARQRMRRKLEVLERRQAVQQERARIALDIHDDLGTILSRIAMVSESAALETEPGSRQQKRLNEICDASRQLTRTMEEIVWAQDPVHDSMDNTVNYFCSFASDLLSIAGIACRLDIPLDLPGIPLEAEKRHELFLVFKEVLNNIIKHSGATETRITLQLQSNALLLIIEDNGRGFRPSEASPFKGNGLGNMQTRLQRAGGRVTIQSEPGKGARIEIYLPISPPAERES